MTGYRRGDVVLVPFPFSERPEQAKRRPALVVSSDAYHRSCDDVIVAQVTSRVETPPRPGDHVVVHWREAGLLAPSLARARLTTLHQSLIVRRLGGMSIEDIAAFSTALASALGLAEKG